MEHGGDLADAIGRFGGEPAEWLDLSTGINPHPWPIPGALRAGDWTRLPSRADLDALGRAARRAYRVPDGLAIVAAPGTQALIQWLPRLAPPGGVAVVGPTYAEHARAWAGAGAPVREVRTVEEAGPGHLVVVNPNNPDGRAVAPGTLLRQAQVAAAEGHWLVVDESFADVTPATSLIPRLGDAPAVVLRSFGKFFGLAGLRLGFAVAPPAIADRIGQALGPWAVSAPALAIGRAALSDESWAAAMRNRLARESATLDGELVRAGVRLVGGTSLFRLAEVGNADAVHERLARARIWTRRFADRPGLLRFGLPPDGAGLGRLGAALGAPPAGAGLSRDGSAR